MSEAADAGGGLALVGEGPPAEIAYTDLISESRGKAAGLLELGVGPGDRIGVFAETTLDFVVSCLAVWHAGAVVVSLAPPTQLLARETWVRRTQKAIVAADARLILAPGDSGERLGTQTAAIESVASREATLDWPDPTAEALVQFSSGTTREPIGVSISHRALTAQAEGLHELRHEDPATDHCVAWVPLYHDLGLIRCLMMSMANGIPVTLMPPSVFVRDPGRWLMEMSRRRATSTSAPNFAYALAARAAQKGLDERVDLSACRFVSCGGELIDPDTIERFCAATEPFGLDPSAMSPGYGLAEATCVVTATRPGEGLVVDPVDRAGLASGRAVPTSLARGGVARLVSVGAALSGMEVRIVSDGREKLEDRKVGEIEVRGPCLMDGYVGREMLSLEGGWLRTGDKGYLVDDLLFVTGRTKDVIVIRGQNYYAEDLERIVQDAVGVRRGRCMAIGVYSGEAEGLVVAAETRFTEPDELQRCRREIVRLLLAEAELAPAEVRLLPPNSLPRSTSGKLQRGLFREQLASGKVDATLVEGPSDV